MLCPLLVNHIALTDDVDGAAWVECVVVNRLGALIGVHMAVEHKIHAVLRVECVLCVVLYVCVCCACVGGEKLTQADSN